jgi:hypothetical protein
VADLPGIPYVSPDPSWANQAAPVDPRIKALMGMGGPAALVSAPALSTKIAMPDAQPSLSLNPVSLPTQTQMLQSKLNSTVNSGSGINQIHNPLLKGFARAADIVGSVFAPRLDMAIPGTELHHQMLVGQQQNQLAESQKNDAIASQAAMAPLQQADEQAQVAARQALAAQEQAKAAALSNPKPTDGDLLYDKNGSPIGFKGGDGTYYGPNDPNLPKGVAAVLGAASAKKPTSEFELWQQQNPNGTAADFQQLQSKPLSKQEADSLNAVWDGLATKHHLPTGQFQAGMPHADATTLAGALNGAIGKQQGDTRVSISLAGQANQNSKNAPLDTSDPATQASVASVANGSVKLQDVFGRGASTAQKAAFVAAVKLVNPSYNSGDHDIENSARRYMISGQGGQTLTAINTAYHHLDQFDAAATAMKNGDVKALNQLANELGVQVQNGTSAPVVFNLVKTALTGELGKSFTGAGATVDEQKNLSTSLGNANNDATYRAVSGTARGLLRGKEQALSGQLSAGEQGKANFGALNSAPAGGDSIPASAASQLQEGVVHTFGNGQQWTKRNGAPVRVN